MLLSSARQDEVLFRARHRQITAIFMMSVPKEDGKTPIFSTDAILDNRQIVTKFGGGTQYGVNVWQQEDRCVPLVETNPATFVGVMQKIRQRTAWLNNGELESLTPAEQSAAYDMEDIVSEANGHPARLTITFNPESCGEEVVTIPFRKLREYALSMQAQLEAEGGSIHSIDVAHRSAIGALDYHRISVHRTLMPGFKITDGFRMLNAAHNLLGIMGVPVAMPGHYKFN